MDLPLPPTCAQASLRAAFLGDSLEPLLAFFLTPQEQRLRRFHPWCLFLIVADTSFDNYDYKVLVTILFVILSLSLSPVLAFW